MKHRWRTIVTVLLVGGFPPILYGPAEATMMTWRPPVVKQVTAVPAKAVVVGGALSIQCVVGANQNLQLDTNSPQGKYLAQERKPSWTVPVKIRVNNQTIEQPQFDAAGLSSLTATWKHSATWKPSAADAGKPAIVECMVDPDKKLFFSSKTVSVPVLLKPVPKVDIGDQGGKGMKAVPPASVPPAR